MVDTALADATAVVALARSSCRLANLAALAEASATVWVARPKVTCTLLPISRVLPPSSRTAGKALAEASPIARAVFEEVDEALGQHLFRLMCEGPESDLTLTENAQPAIMANAIATLRVLEKEGAVRLSEKCNFVAGHSLGEYTALCAAGALPLSVTAALLKLRGRAMQAAVPVGVGAMAALLGADIEKAESLAAAAAEGETCTVANDNDPSQVVISGHKGAIDRAILLANQFRT